MTEYKARIMGKGTGEPMLVIAPHVDNISTFKWLGATASFRVKGPSRWWKVWERSHIKTIWVEGHDA